MCGVLMHPLAKWVDCDDPNCRCNDWLAKQSPIPVNRTFVSKTPRSGLKHPSRRAYEEGCRKSCCANYAAVRQQKYRLAKKLGLA